MIRILACSVPLLLIATAEAQPRGLPPGSPAGGQRPGDNRTTLSVELIYGRDGGALHAQRWAQLFDQWQLPLRIRQSALDDKPDVQERTVGTTRQVTVVGRLDRAGRAVFPDRAFTLAEATKLREWLNELQTYGAQGAPDGQPLWGLTKQQFGTLYAALARPQEPDVAGLALEAALPRLGAADRYPVRLSPAAQQLLRQNPAKPRPVRQSVAGIGRGTALAVVLGEYGLGFRPTRTPAGTLELAIEPLRQADDLWPVGWELAETRQQTAPKLFEIVPVELDDVKLTDVLAAVAARTEVPVLIDHHRIEARQIALDTLTVSVPPKRSSWSQLLRSVTVPHKMTSHLKMDELGQPLVWITTLEPARSER